MRDGRNHMGIFSLFCLVSFIRPVKQREICTRTQTHMECDDLCSNTTSCCVRLLLFWESVCLSLPSWCQLLCIVSKEDLTVISFQAFFFCLKCFQLFPLKWIRCENSQCDNRPSQDDGYLFSFRDDGSPRTQSLIIISLYCFLLYVCSLLKEKKKNNFKGCTC